MENQYSVMNRVMLRFRPIAPKPAGGDNLSAAEGTNGAAKYGRRTKRKYVRVRPRQTTKTKSTEEGRSSPRERSGISDGSPPERAVVTLQLLPERSESESERSCCYSSSSALKFQDIIDPDRHRFGDQVIYNSEVVGVTAATWIVVECVTDTYIDDGGVGLGNSDEKILKDLQADTCPGFVSDGANNVVWVNDACRRMVAGGEAAVRLVVREKLPYFSPSFACRVRMVQQTKQGQKWNKIVACDVWKMEVAAFAWKLDVQTAIGLGV